MKRTGSGAGAPALVDARTGLYNREGFLSLARQTALFAARKRRDLVLVNARLEGLAELNERLGRAAGDRALAEAAELLSSTFRRSDVLSRFGGDRFVMIAVQGRSGGGTALVERLLENVERRNREAKAGRALALRVSAASFDPESACLEGMLEQSSS